MRNNKAVNIKQETGNSKARPWKKYGLKVLFFVNFCWGWHILTLNYSHRGNVFR